LSERTDIQELGNENETTEERWDEVPERDEWDELSEEELPPRPRNRFLRPLPIALLALLIASTGFLAGVLVQKGNGGSNGGGLPSGAELPGLASAGGSGDGASALPAFASASQESAASGTVSSVDGDTIYVKEADGTVVAVRAQDGSTITRDAVVGARAIHPGDSVVVQGSKNGSTVSASAISATEAGVESAAGAGTTGGGEADDNSESEGSASVGSLFGE